ncbi:MAG: diguanylate cyclase, partial [Candidatus Eremiobacteraeota bacterium]|nr:diguanylate cyclase [Candidatus Eremiobacteraeota bacterium]
MQALNTRNAQVSAQADAFQKLRLQRLALEVNDFTSDAAQLTNTAASGPCTVRNDRVLIEHLLAGLLNSRINSQIYGLGCFFEPRVFDGHSRYYGPYAETRDGRTGIERNDDGSYRYFGLPWYRYGVAEKGRLTAFGPYLELHRQFLSFLRAFYLHGRLAGVVSVDARADNLSSIIAAGLPPSDSAFFEAIDGRHTLTIGSMPKAGVPSVDMSADIRFTKERLHLTSDRSWVVKSSQHAVEVAAAAVLGIWLLALLLGVMFVRAWRAKRETLKMQVERDRLESELMLQAQVEARLRKAAYTDTLTGLPNRAFLLEALSQHLGEKRRSLASLAFVDIDSFSLVNDTLGHESGDQLLVGLGARIAAAFPGDLVARLGGDEFAIFSRRADEAIENDAHRIAAAFKIPSNVRKREIFCTASVGMVSIDHSYVVAEDVLRDAEIAMYASKDHLRGSWAVFN